MVTICEEDRKEMFLRRHVEIPSGSRCCEVHTINNRLLPEAFLSLVPHRMEYRFVSSQSLINVLQLYRTRLNCRKHLDFDECMPLTETDYVKLTGFTRAQHAQILSHIPSGAMRSSATRSVQSALGYLLMKLKLGLSDLVLASMVGIGSKRKTGRIFSNVRGALVRHFVPSYLGVAHIARQDVIDKHTSPIAIRLLTEGRHPCILALDGTYLYIQVGYTKNKLKLILSFEKYRKVEITQLNVRHSIYRRSGRWLNPWL